jgi:hypothetical protein
MQIIEQTPPRQELRHHNILIIIDTHPCINPQLPI